MRKKLKHVFIANASKRRTTFSKRQNGLLKKMSELTTLCEIPGCAIIYSPYDSQPEVWPSPEVVQQIASQIKTMPELKESKKILNQESFLPQRISKANEQLKRQRKENRENEVTQVIFQSLGGKSMTNLNGQDLNDLGSLIDQNLKEIIEKIETLTVNPHNNSDEDSVPVVEISVDEDSDEESETSVAGDSDEESIGLGGRMLRQQLRDFRRRCGW